MGWVAAAGVALGAFAPANAALEIAPFMYEIDGWQIVALEDEGTVEHLVMLRLEAAPDPEANISAVMATHDDAEGWSAVAWAGEDPHSVIWWVAAEFGLPDPAEPLSPWMFNLIDPDQAPYYSVADDPEEYADGVLASSIWADAIAVADDPQPLTEALEMVGEPAASSAAVSKGRVTGPTDPIDPQPADCDDIAITTPDQIWDAVKASIEAEMTQPGTMEEVFDETIDPLRVWWCCLPRYWTTHTTTWNCTGPPPISTFGGGCEYYICTGTQVGTRWAVIPPLCTTMIVGTWTKTIGPIATNDCNDDGNGGCPPQPAPDSCGF